MEAEMGDVHRKRFQKILDLLGALEFRSNPSTGEVLNLAAIIAPQRRRFLAKYENAWWELRHAKTIQEALLICSGGSLPEWLAIAATDFVRQHISKREKLIRYELAIHLARSLAVIEAHERGETWDESYVTAEKIFAKTIARGRPETMRASYKRVQKQVKAGKCAQVLLWIDIIAAAGLLTHKHYVFPEERPDKPRRKPGPKIRR